MFGFIQLEEVVLPFTEIGIDVRTTPKELIPLRILDWRQLLFYIDICLPNKDSQLPPPSSPTG